MEIRTIAVIGAGKTGRSIALAAVNGGYRTILEDISRAVREQGLSWIQHALDEAHSSGTIPASPKKGLFSLLTTASAAEDACREADLIIEAVPEEMEMKTELFTIFDKFAKPGAIFATSASSLSIAEMASVTLYRERCIGMRFSRQAGAKLLLELVKGPDTSEETVASCREVGRRIGSEVVEVQEPVSGVMAATPDAGCRIQRKEAGS
jgi:3-hydroxybutyryl-CoA dehydrogenase